jgi:hypothetical protein
VFFSGWSAAEGMLWRHCRGKPESIHTGTTLKQAETLACGMAGVWHGSGGMARVG